MEKVMGYWRLLKNMLGEIWKSNPDMLLGVVILTILVLLLALILILINGSNKVKLKKSLTENFELKKKNNVLREYLFQAQDSINSMQEKIELLQSNAFEQIFTPEIVAGIVNQDKKIVQIAEDNFQFTQKLTELGLSPEEIQELRDKHKPEEDMPSKANLGFDGLPIH